MTQEDENIEYMLVRALARNEVKFVPTDTTEALSAFRTKHGNRDLAVSAWQYNQPDLKAQGTSSLYFYVCACELEENRRSAIEAIYYISENLSIPEDCIEVIYNGGGHIGAAGSAANSDGESSNNAGNANSTAAETVILIPPIVFAGQPTLLMPVINYQLARQLVEDVTENIDIDVYHQDYLIRLPNSINSQTGSYVIPLTIKELLYMDAYAIAELSKQPRPEDSLIMPRTVPEAVEWFSSLLKETEKEQERQHQLQNLLFKDGWQTSPCTRRLLWADLDKNNALEACRITSQFYSWLGASSGEIWYRLQQIDRRNRIDDYPRLKAIIVFALENPRFIDCEHTLVRRFCPAGKCFMAELIAELEQPHLFEGL